MQTRFPNRILPYLLLAPSILVVVVFFVIPSVQSIQLSLYRVNALGDRRIFVGIQNFARLFADPDYLNSAVVSLWFALLVVVAGLALSLLVAVVANQRLRGFALYRTLLIWPYALSPSIAGLIWALMLEPSFGLASHLVTSITGLEFNFRTSAQHAIVFLAIAATWKMLGYNIIFFLAGLRGLPTELLEAASVDGASSWLRFWRIAFPLLSPTTFFLFVMNTLYAFFEGFGLVHITTAGGPGRATDLLVFKLYRDGFIGLNTGYAAAQSVLLLIMVAVLTTLQFRYAGNKVFYQ